jgi:drug/metabolite transporter (DMT)-like permease
MPHFDLWTWLENLPIAIHIGESWWFPFLESIHVLTSTFMVGSIAMLDLRLLGLAARSHAASRITKEILPWTRGAFAVSALAGVGMFISQANRYVDNRAFQVKAVLLILAGLNMAVFHLGTARSMPRWDTAAVTSAAARLAGVGSLLLWIAIMLAGRWIGHLS